MMTSNTQRLTRLTFLGLAAMGMALGLTACPAPAITTPPAKRPSPTTAAQPAMAAPPPPRKLIADGMRTCQLQGDRVECWGAFPRSWKQEMEVHRHSTPYGAAGRIRYDTGPGTELALLSTSVCVRVAGGVHCFDGDSRTELPGLEAMTHLDTSGVHGCAVDSTATLQCIGFMPHMRGTKAGEELLERILQDKPISARALPVEHVIDMDVSQSGVCAVDRDGIAHCFLRRRGDAEPVFRPNVPAATAIAVGGGAACSVGKDGRIACFEANDRTAVTLAGIDDAVDIVASHSGFCAKRESGKVACWAFSGWHVLDGVRTSGQELAHFNLDVDGAEGADYLTMGERHLCLIDKEGLKRCIGDNTFGQLGKRTHAPKQPRWLQGAKKIFQLNNEYICAQNDEDGAHCLHHQGGELKLMVEHPVAGFAPDENESTLALLDEKGTLFMDDGYKQPFEARPFWTSAERVRMMPRPAKLPVKARWIGFGYDGEQDSIVVAGTDGSWWMGGLDDEPEGPWKQLKKLAPITQLLAVRGNATSGSHGLCYVRRDRTLRCEQVQAHGLHMAGELKVSAQVPVVIDQVQQAQANCVLRAGKVLCWRRQLEAGKKPQPIAGLPAGVKTFAGSSLHGCALLGTGKVYCWHEGQGFDEEMTMTPLQPAPEKAVEIAMNDYFSCVREEGGRVTCWGAARALHSYEKVTLP